MKKHSPTQPVSLSWRKPTLPELAQITKADPASPVDVYAALKLCAKGWDSPEKFSQDLFESTIPFERAVELLTELKTLHRIDAP